MCSVEEAWSHFMVFRKCLDMTICCGFGTCLHNTKICCVFHHISGLQLRLSNHERSERMISSTIVMNSILFQHNMKLFPLIIPFYLILLKEYPFVSCC